MPKSKKRKFRLIVSREPNGQLSRQAAAREFAPTQIKRLRDAALAGMADPQWATALGRLFLENKIDASQYEAGKRWAEKVARYYAAIGTPPSIQAAPLELRGKASPPDPDSEQGQGQARRDANASANFRAAHAVIAGDRAVESAVRSLCECDENPAGAVMLENAQTGLQKLAIFWNLTNQTKRRTVGLSR